MYYQRLKSNFFYKKIKIIFTFTLTFLIFRKEYQVFHLKKACLHFFKIEFNIPYMGKNHFNFLKLIKQYNNNLLTQHLSKTFKFLT